jgi:hypothetical protein
MTRFARLVPILALLACGCKEKAPAHGKMGVSIPIAPPTFRVIPAGLDPNTAPIPGAVGDIIQVSGSRKSYALTLTGWVDFPSTGGGVPDGGLAISTIDGGGLVGTGTVASPLGVVGFPGTLVGPVVGSSTASWTVSGLSGETDGDYEGVIHLVVGAGTADLEFLPNGSTANTNSVTFQVYFGGGVSPINQSAYLDFGNFTAADEAEIRFRISSKKQAGRLFEAHSYRNVGGTITQWNTMGAWTDATAVMTSFVIRFSTNAAGDLAAGSWMKWRPLGFTAG